MHTRWGKSRGLGYVEYENIDDAINAKNNLHNHRLEDRSIIVDYAQPDPFLTPEGKARHEEAQERHHQKFHQSNFLPHPDSDQKTYIRRPNLDEVSDHPKKNNYKGGTNSKKS